MAWIGQNCGRSRVTWMLSAAAASCSKLASISPVVSTRPTWITDIAVLLGING